MDEKKSDSRMTHSGQVIDVEFGSPHPLISPNKETNLATSRPTLANDSEPPVLQHQKTIHLTTIHLERVQILQLLQEAIKRGIPLNKAELKRYKEELAEKIHLQSIDEVMKRCDTNTKGLSGQEASARLKRDGQNVLTPPPQQSMLSKFLWSLVSGFGLILWIATILVFLAWRPLGNPPDPNNLGLAIVLLFVIFFQAGFSFYQEHSSSQVLESFKKILPSATDVWRDGALTKVPARELVIGDIVSLSPGSGIPADLRLINVSNLKIDKSMLTGENEPVPCTVDSAEKNPLEAPNIAFLGTSVIEGSALGVVYRSGDSCEMGKIIKLATAEPSQSDVTLLQIEMNYFVKMIVTCACVASAILFIGWVAWLRVYRSSFMSLSGIITNIISTFVAFIPDGLPMAITVTLALVAQRLCKQYHVMVTNLQTVETLGCMSALASDKTGTLTQNKMTVRHITVGHESLFAEKVKAGPLSNETKELLRASILCNKADASRKLKHGAEKIHVVGGSALESAIAKFYLEQKDAPDDLNEIRSQYPLIGEIPFSSRTKWMLTMHKCPSNAAATASAPAPAPAAAAAAAAATSKVAIIIKGAPEFVLKKCDYILRNSDKNDRTSGMIEEKMDENSKVKIQNCIDEFGRGGERVIALCQLVLNAGDPRLPAKMEFNFEKPNFPTDSGFVFLGVVSVMDPPRPAVKEAVETLTKAHIKVMMVTGDHATTAVAIAREVSIITKNTVHNVRISEDTTDFGAIAVTGEELEGFDEAKWKWVLNHKEIVFARTSPEHKLKIVSALQKLGHVVGVTGDGVNDSPAMKRADVAIAMGSGSDVARNSSDMILLQDDFAAVVHAVAQGRLAFDNLKKVIAYLLPAGSFSEVLPVFANIFLGMPLPLSAFLMIYICVLTDVFSSLALVHEGPEKNIMTRLPRNPKTDHLFDWKMLVHVYGFVGLLESFAAFFLFALHMHDHGLSTSQWLLAFESWDGSDPVLDNTWREGQSIFFVTLIVCQIGNLMSTRTRQIPVSFRKWQCGSNILLAVVASLMLGVFATEVPFMNTTFGTRRVSAKFWGYAWICALVVFLLSEAKKRIARSYPEGFLAKIAW